MQLPEIVAELVSVSHKEVFDEYYREDELYEGMDELLTGISVKMIGTVFGAWINRPHHVIGGNGEYIA
jgi:hypothetical protein